MIQKVSGPPLAFERTVREILTDPLSQFGFHCEATFPLYANEQVEFTRFRQGVKETVWIGRCIYDDEDLAHPKRNDEVDEPYESGQGRLWRSRHFFYVQLVVNGGHTDLFPTGKIAYSLDGADLWRFTDEADLARRLRDEALPYLLTDVMRHFDERLDNALDLIERGVETPYRPPDAA